jgi:hypothetical protein
MAQAAARWNPHEFAKNPALLALGLTARACGAAVTWLRERAP